MTMLEIMIVLAIMGSMMALLGGGFLKADSTRLREASAEVTMTLRSAYNLATMTGKHHRVVFDLDKQNYHIERCDGRQTLMRGDEEENEDELDVLEELKEKMEEKASQSIPDEVAQADSPEEAFASMAALEGLRVGSFLCQETTKSFTGQEMPNKNQHQLDAKRGIKIKVIHVQHLTKPVEEGKASINFFPIGSSEKAIVEVGSRDDESFSIQVHGMTSRVAMKKGEIDAERYLHRNAVGDREVAR